jgi:hypothetical protein
MKNYEEFEGEVMRSGFSIYGPDQYTGGLWCFHKELSDRGECKITGSCNPKTGEYCLQLMFDEASTPDKVCELRRILNSKCRNRGVESILDKAASDFRKTFKIPGGIKLPLYRIQSPAFQIGVPSVTGKSFDKAYKKLQQVAKFLEINMG